MKRIHLLILISALLIIGLISCSSRLNPSDDNSSEAKENNILDNINGASDNDNPTATSGVKELSSNSETSEDNSHNSSSDNPIAISEGKEPSSNGSSSREKPSTPISVPTFLERVKGATYEGSGYTYKFSTNGETIDCGENGKHATYIYVQQDDDNRAVYKEENAPWYKFGFIYYGLKLDKDDILYWTSPFDNPKTTPSSWAISYKAKRQTK